MLLDGIDEAAGRTHAVCGLLASLSAMGVQTVATGRADGLPPEGALPRSPAIFHDLTQSLVTDLL